MKILNVALSGVIALSAIVFLAYLGFYYFDFGLFTTLPESIAGFFLRNDFLQYVALGVLGVAVAAKVRVSRALARARAAEERVEVR